MEAQGCGRNANADGGHVKQTTRIQGKEAESGIAQSTLTMLKPLQLRLEMIVQFPKRSHGWVTTVTTRTFRIRGHVWTIHDVRTNYHDRGLNDNIVALFSGFYATVARRKSTQGS